MPLGPAGDALAERGPLPWDRKRQHFRNSDELCDYVARAMGGMCFLGFSCGKDSIAAYLQLRRFFRTIVLVYFYYVPGLSFIEDSLRYYEDTFGQRIHRLPHESLGEAVTFGIYSYPQHHRLWFEAAVHRNMSMETGYDYLRRQYRSASFGASRYALYAEGRRMADAFRRRLSIMKHGSIVAKQGRFYPVYDWSNARVVTEIRASGVKLPIDYRIFGRTFEGPRADQLDVIKKVFPDDYDRILEYFPLAEGDAARRRFFTTEGLVGVT